MKKLLFSVVLLLAWPALLQAQTEAGKVLIGTSTNLYGTNMFTTGCPNMAGWTIMTDKYKSDDYDSEPTQYTQIDVAPRAGVFLFDNLLVGAELSFASFKSEQSDKANTYFAGGPYVRYYLNLGRIHPFVQTGVNFGKLKEGAVFRDEFDTLGYGGGLGAAFFFSDKVAFDFLLNYAHFTIRETERSNDAKEIRDAFGVGIGLSVFL